MSIEGPEGNRVPGGDAGRASGRFAAVVVAIGMLALVGELILVFAAAILRNLGVALPGTVESVELLIAVIASAAIVRATLAGNHATIKLAIDRVSARVRNRLHVFVHLCGALYWAMLALGTTWIIFEVWGRQEATMLLELPVVPFRIVWLLACVSIVVLLLVRAFSARAARGAQDDA